MSLEEALKIKDDAIQEAYLNSEKRKNLISEKILKLYSELNDEENLVQAQIEKIMQTYLASVEQENKFIESNNANDDSLITETKVGEKK